MITVFRARMHSSRRMQSATKHVMWQRSSNMLVPETDWRVLTSNGVRIQKLIHPSIKVDQPLDIPPSSTARSKTWMTSVFKSWFLPVGYPHSVTSNYTVFIKYNMIQVSLIALTRILSTQAMLLAVGLGQSGALPMAAVMSWILKDGIGHLGSIALGTSINTKFDSDPKKYKYISVMLGQGANLLGILSLAKPGLFLLLTSLSASLSRVGTLAFTSSRARIYANFSRAGNLGDLTRCSQSQATLATIAGTAVAIALSPFIGSDVTHLLAVFAPSTVATHYFALEAVRVLELNTLNRQRMEIVLNHYFSSASVLSPHEVSLVEKVLFHRQQFPININPPISQVLLNPHLSQRLLDDGYLTLKDGSNIISLYYRDTVTSDQVLRGFVEATSLASDSNHAVPWATLREDLSRAGWDLSITFIDPVAYRVNLE